MNIVRRVAAVLLSFPFLAAPALAERAVAVNTAVIFAAPGLDQQRIGQVGTGEWVNVEFCEGEWCFIRAEAGRKGWTKWALLAAPGQGWNGGTARPSATPGAPGTQVFQGIESDAGSYQPPPSQSGQQQIFKVLPLQMQMQ